MFDCLVWGYLIYFSAVRSIQSLSKPYINAARIINNEFRRYSTPNKVSSYVAMDIGIKNSLVKNKQILDITNKLVSVPIRTVTKFSINKGKRKTVKAVTRRFFRLNWGIWIRPMVGRHKKLWKKSPPNRRRLRQHVFTNATQSTLLDKMVTKFWKRPKHFVDDPYNSYHTRDEYPITRLKPVPPK